MNTEHTQPSIITPTKPRDTNNPRSALATLDSESEASVQEHKFLPNQPAKNNDNKQNTESDSDSSMKDSFAGSKLDTNLTQEKLIKLMEDIQPGCITQHGHMADYAHTDVADFQPIMGKALT